MNSADKQKLGFAFAIVIGSNIIPFYRRADNRLWLTFFFWVLYGVYLF